MGVFVSRFLARVRWLARLAQLKLDDVLIRLTEVSQPGWLNRTARGVAVKARLALLIFLESGQGRAEFWQGMEQGSGRLLRVAYLADQRSYKVHSPQYLQHILFQPGTLQIRDYRSYPVFRSRALAVEMGREADLVIVEENKLLHWTPPAGVWLYVPLWVRMVMRFPAGQSWEEIEKGMRSHKHNIKLALRNRFTCQISHAVEDFDFFYKAMHVPMMEERHAGYGMVDNQDAMREQFRNGLLLFIRQPAAENQPAAVDQPACEGLAVAGALVYLRGRSAFGISNGILNGDQKWYAQGAVSALYYHNFRWCYENQIERFDAGGCRPFMTDGLYQFKYHWGLRPVQDLWNERQWLFWAPTSAPVAIDWLNSHPVVLSEGPRDLRQEGNFPAAPPAGKSGQVQALGQPRSLN